MIKEKDLLKTFGIEKPKKDQLFRIMWVEKDSAIFGSTPRPLKDAEDLLYKTLDKKYYVLANKRIASSNKKFSRWAINCKPTTELRNSYVIPIED